MGSRLFLLIIVSCAFLLCESGSYPKADFIKRTNNYPSVELVRLSCECNNDVLMEMLNVSMTTVLDIFARKAPCHLEKFHTHARICELLEKCEVCTAETEQCEFKKVHGMELDPNCSLIIHRLTNFKSNRKIRSLTDTDLASTRQRRYSSVCPHPPELSNSLLKLTFYHSGLKISQKCKYGHTLSNGISRVFRCRYDENVWYPEEFIFEACEPFIHCEMILKYHGTAKCVTATIDVAPVCRVSCPRYEDQPADDRTSKCDIDGLWKPELPHCASKVDGENLVPAPKIKLHYLEEEIGKGLGESNRKLVEEH